MRIPAYIFFWATLIFCAEAHAEDVTTWFTSFAGFDLGTVKLVEIQKALGPAELVESGDAGEYTASVCYSVPNVDILFFSGELDGPEHVLEGFGIAEETDRQPCSRWPAMRAMPNPIIGGLHLGMSIPEFTRLVGAPVHMEGQMAYVHFESKRKMSQTEFERFPKDVQRMVQSGEQQDFYDVIISIVATFKNGRLHELRIWKTETT